MEETGQKNNTRENNIETQVKYSKGGNSQGIFSSKTIDDYSRIQYNTYGWVAVNNVLTVNELKRFYKQFADTKMLGFNYQKSFDGYYMIPTGDVSMEDNKDVFVSGTVQDPYIDRVLTINNVSNDELSYYVSEVINCGGQLESISYLEDLAGKRLFEEYTSADFEDYGTRKKRGKGFDAAGSPNSNENSGRKRSSKKRDGFGKKLDQNYLTAVERGDMETAQRMLNVFLNICFNNLRQYRTIHMCGIALSQIILLKNTFVI